MDAGDGTCNEFSSWCEKQSWWGMKAYRITTSLDGGWTWTRGEVMHDQDGHAMGSARPKLLTLARPGKSTASSPLLPPLLLAGGRPGLWLWLSLDAGRSWKSHNIAQIHNALLPNDPQLHYCPGFVDAVPANESTFFSPAQSGFYMSLLQLDDEETALLCYNREPVVPPFEDKHMQPPASCYPGFEEPSTTQCMQVTYNGSSSSSRRLKKTNDDGTHHQAGHSTRLKCDEPHQQQAALTTAAMHRDRAADPSFAGVWIIDTSACSSSPGGGGFKAEHGNRPQSTFRWLTLKTDESPAVDVRAGFLGTVHPSILVSGDPSTNLSVQEEFGFGAVMVYNTYRSVVSSCCYPKTMSIDFLPRGRAVKIACCENCSPEGGMTLRDSVTYHCQNASVNQLSMLIAPPSEGGVQSNP